MRKITKFIGILLAAVFIAAAFTACDDSEGGDEKRLNPLFIGTWESADSGNVYTRLELGRDGLFTLTVRGVVTSGTYNGEWYNREKYLYLDFDSDDCKIFNFRQINNELYIWEKGDSENHAQRFKRVMSPQR